MTSDNTPERTAHAEAARRLERLLDAEIQRFAALVLADLTRVKTLAVEPNA